MQLKAKKSYGVLSSIQFVTNSSYYISVRNPPINTQNLSRENVKCERYLDRYELKCIMEGKEK